MVMYMPQTATGTITNLSKFLPVVGVLTVVLRHVIISTTFLSPFHLTEIFYTNTTLSPSCCGSALLDS